jgi:PadR family transcriptional regulator AphA
MSQSTPTTELALLGFLNREPMHGYAIHQQLADPQGLGPVWQVKQSLLYAMLGKLEDAGYITAVSEAQDNKPPRKVFHLTEEGEKVYLGWLGSPVQNGRSLRLEFLVKLYFARREGANFTARLMTAQRAQCHAWLAAERAIIDKEKACGRQYSCLVHQFRLGQIQAMIDWLDQCEEEKFHEK